MIINNQLEELVKSLGFTLIEDMTTGVIHEYHIFNGEEIIFTSKSSFQEFAYTELEIWIQGYMYQLKEAYQI